MSRRYLVLLALPLLAAATGAQTSTPGGIDVEIYSQVDGTNSFCAAVGDTIDAYLLVRPGSGTTSCDVACGTVSGGAGSLATGLVEVAFDPAALELVSAVTNSGSPAAAEGILRLIGADGGRIGWALGGDWRPDGSTAGTLLEPCWQTPLSETTWVARITLRVLRSGTTPIHLRRGTDAEPFPLSFADFCGTAAFTEDTGGIDEVIDAVVRTACGPDLIFADDFEDGTPAAWSVAVGLAPEQIGR